MQLYRNALPQLSGGLFLTDGGVETDIIFNHGIEIPEFACFTLLQTPAGRAALTRYFEGFLTLAKETGAGFILDSATWKAHRHWGKSLGMDATELRSLNEESIRFIADLRARFSANAQPIVLSAVVGPRGDAYRPEGIITMHAAEDYFSEQLGWLAATEADMITALTFNQATEAAGLALAARALRMPTVISFTVETNGALPNGQSLADAVALVDEATDGYPAYYMVNCAHPDHFDRVLRDGAWARRIRGLRANASRKSHAELDESTALDAGNPQELAAQYRQLAEHMPWVNVFGGCCGTDLRHVTAIARGLHRSPPA